MTARDVEVAPTLPWAPEAEQSVLGAVLTDPESLDGIAERGLKPEHFYDHRHRVILAAIEEVNARHHPVDVVTVFESLRDRGQDEAAGGLAYINALAGCVASARNVGRYADIVLDKAMRRRMVEAAQQAMDLAGGTGDTPEVLDRIESLFVGLRHQRAAKSLRRIGDLMLERVAHWEALEQGTAPSGLPTGFTILDDAFGGGLKPGRNIVLAGRPGTGKTSLAFQIAATIAAQQQPVLFLSQEMPAGDLVDRAAANMGRVDLSRLANGRFRDGDWSRISEACDVAVPAPLFVDDQPALTLLDIRSKAREVQRECKGLALVVVDYLQLTASSSTASSRHHQIETISRGMKTLAKELNTTVLLLSQLTRESEKEEPELQHLKESGAIEEDADAVILLHALGDAPEGGLLILAKVAKNRQGRRGRIGLAFSGDTQSWQQSQGVVSRQKGIR